MFVIKSRQYYRPERKLLSIDRGRSRLCGTSVHPRGAGAVDTRHAETRFVYHSDQTTRYHAHVTVETADRTALPPKKEEQKRSMLIGDAGVVPRRRGFSRVWADPVRVIWNQYGAVTLRRATRRSVFVVVLWSPPPRKHRENDPS